MHKMIKIEVYDVTVTKENDNQVTIAMKTDQLNMINNLSMRTSASSGEINSFIRCFGQCIFFTFSLSNKNNVAYNRQTSLDFEFLMNVSSINLDDEMQKKTITPALPLAPNERKFLPIKNKIETGMNLKELNDLANNKTIQLKDTLLIIPDFPE